MIFIKFMNNFSRFFLILMGIFFHSGVMVYPYDSDHDMSPVVYTQSESIQAVRDDKGHIIYLSQKTQKWGDQSPNKLIKTLPEIMEDHVKIQISNN